MIMNRIKQAFMKLLSDDSSTYPRATTNYKGKDVQTVRQSVYGVSSNPPKQSLCLLFQVEGMGGVQYGIFDYAQGRFKNLEEGEVQIGNYLTSASIKFDKEGNVIVTVPNNITFNVTGNSTVNTSRLTINASDDVYINSDLIVSGDITGNNFISSGISVDFNTHVHGGVETGGGSTSTPS